MIAVPILSLVLLVCLWAVGEQEFRTKLILTAVYAILWGVFFVPNAAPFVVAAKCLWCIIVGFGTFGKHFRK